MTKFSCLTLKDVDCYEGGKKPKAKRQILNLVKWFKLNPYVKNRHCTDRTGPAEFSQKHCREVKNLKVMQLPQNVNLYIYPC